MKAPNNGGLPALHRRSTSSNPMQDIFAPRKRSSKQRQPVNTSPKSTLLSAVMQISALAMLMALWVLCYSIPKLRGEFNLLGSVTSRSHEWTAPLSILILCAVSVAVSGLVWTRMFRSRFANVKIRQRLLGLIFMLPAITGMMIGEALYGTSVGRAGIGTTIAGACVIASSLLFATVIGRTASTLVILALCVIYASLGISAPWPIWAIAIAAVIAQYPARRLRDRTAVIRAATVTMFAAGISGLVISGIAFQDIAQASYIGMQCLMTGCLGAAGWFTLLTVMERPYELTTPLGLLELLDPTRPILERFAREAPGTYAHSIMVGHLAATAADSIGADALLCRVAAQYHDIGKMSRAQFFKENQADSENVHDRLNPSLSAIVVNSHVKDGERIAIELGLPSAIRDIITQHHGTTLMRYFYYRAAAGARPRFDDPLQYQFRYSGPKPQTKEAAIMMLADSIEAASRTLNNPTPESVDTLIGGIISDRVEDRQLDECPLTIRDMATIRKTFNNVLCAMMHQRVEYPGSGMLEQEEILAKPSETHLIASDEALVHTEPFDFYEDFDPSILSQVNIGRFDDPRSTQSAHRKITVGQPLRAKIISASRREAIARRQIGGSKRPYHK